MALSLPIQLELRSGQFPDAAVVAVWDRYTIAISMLQPGTPFTFTLWRTAVASNATGTNPDANNTAGTPARITEDSSGWDVLRSRAKVGGSVRFFIDGGLQLDGVCESVRIGADRNGATITISGRDKSGVATSFDADPKVSLRGLPLGEALTRIFAPVGLDVVITEAAAARAVTLRDAGIRRPRRRSSRARRRNSVDLAHPRPGDKIWQLADTMVRRQGYMMWVVPGETGLTVVVDVPAFGSPRRFTFRRQFGAFGAPGFVASGNILSGFETYDVREVPSEVHVYTGTARGDNVSARTEAISDNGVFNNTPGSGRINRGYVSVPFRVQPRHIKSQRARTIAAGLNEGDRVLADAMARFRVYEIMVQGHGQEDPETGRVILYAVNTMCRVYDELCASADGAPLDEEMLITSVTFEGSRQAGQTTRLELVPKGSIILSPVEPS